MGLLDSRISCCETWSDSKPKWENLECRSFVAKDVGDTPPSHGKLTEIGQQEGFAVGCKITRFFQNLERGKRTFLEGGASLSTKCATTRTASRWSRPMWDP